jgi:hypothetical protein
MRLRDVRDDDVDAYVRIRCDPVMMAELGGPLPREGIEEILHRHVRNARSGNALICMIVPLHDRARRRPLGGRGHRRPDDRRARRGVAGRDGLGGAAGVPGPRVGHGRGRPVVGPRPLVGPLGTRARLSRRHERGVERCLPLGGVHARRPTRRVVRREVVPQQRLAHRCRDADGRQPRVVTGPFPRCRSSRRATP